MRRLPDHVETVVLDNSPVSFAVTGPGDHHRRVYIRSNDANLDLVGMDSGVFDKVKRRRSTISEHIFTWSADKRDGLHPLIVRSDPDASPADNRNNRRSFLSFIWRGFAGAGDLELIEDTFRRLAPDIQESLSNYNPKSVEWTIGILIAICDECTSRRLRRLRFFKSVAVFTLAIYLIFGAGLLLKAIDITPQLTP